MASDEQVDRTIAMIRDSCESMEKSEPDRAEDLMKALYDSIVEQYDGDVGMQSMMLSMASGDIRHLARDDSDFLFDKWNGWTAADGLDPGQARVADIRKASKRLYGREDAFVWEPMPGLSTPDAKR